MKNQGPDGVTERFDKFAKVKALMQQRKQTLGEIITNEMGKPLKESMGEVDKSIGMIDYYINNAESFLKDEVIPTKFPKTTIV